MTDKQQPASTSSAPSAAVLDHQHDPALSVVYVTSTAIFVPDVGVPTAAGQSTVLSSLTSDTYPDQTLANVAGATGPSGSGMLVHIFACLATDTDSGNMSNARTPPPPPFVAVLDEEEAVNRSANVAPARIEKRVTAIRDKVKLLRFIALEERERFLNSASLDLDTTMAAKQLLEMCPGGATSPQLRAVIGVLVGKLPMLRLSRFLEADSSANSVKVSLR